ncbi:unnamed protein product [Trichobilharzia regenti]|nr:unnamed protein product [Trichobilharzia regenti]
MITRRLATGYSIYRKVSFRKSMESSFISIYESCFPSTKYRRSYSA